MYTTTNYNRTTAQTLIVNAIHLEDYGFEAVNTTDKLGALAKIFKSEYMHKNHIKRYKTISNIFKEWIKGVPSAFVMPIYYSEVFAVMDVLEMSYNEDNGPEAYNDFLNVISFEVSELMKDAKITEYSI